MTIELSERLNSNLAWLEVATPWGKAHDVMVSSLGYYIELASADDARRTVSQ